MAPGGPGTMHVCPRCGTAQVEQRLTCRRCGRYMHEVGTANARHSSVPGVVIGVVVLLLIGGLAAFFIWKQTPPKEEPAKVETPAVQTAQTQPPAKKRHRRHKH